MCIRCGKTARWLRRLAANRPCEDDRATARFGPLSGQKTNERRAAPRQFTVPHIQQRRGSQRETLPTPNGPVHRAVNSNTQVSHHLRNGETFDSRIRPALRIGAVVMVSDLRVKASRLTV